MSKAILIIDMPDKCENCLLVDDETDWCLAENRDIYKVRNNKKPKWCPLREIPQKEKVNPCVCHNVNCTDYGKGWNDCIDKILKEND